MSLVCFLLLLKLWKILFCEYFTHEKTFFYVLPITMNLDSWQLLWGMVVDTFALMGQCFMECPLQLFKQIAGFITSYLSQGTPLPLTQGTTQSKWGLNLIHSFPHLQGRMWYILAFFLNIPAQENCRDDWLTKTQNPQPPPPHFHETKKTKRLSN